MQSERRTTSEAIALRNVDAEIGALERRVRARPGDVGAAAALVDALAMRALCLGRIADHVRAEAVAEELVRAAPAQAKSYLARARARSAMHRFDDALADLREAEAQGAIEEDVIVARAGILEELGEREAARRLLETAGGRGNGVLALAALATLRAQGGDVDEAERLFRRALDEYRDVSPFPVAWIHLRHARVVEQNGQIERARELYAAALARLPSFVPALSLLADLEAAQGNPARAIELLRRAVEISDDPDHLSRLALLLRRQGEEEEAARLRDEAQRHFEVLVAEHPAAFAAHAAEFWLDVGGDAQRAVELARLNAAVRHRPQDRDLLARAEEAVQHQDVPGS